MKLLQFATPFYLLLILVFTSVISYEADRCGEITEIPQLVNEEPSPALKDYEEEEGNEDDNMETRVRMGTAVTNRRYPWMVAIQTKKEGVIGGGSLITKRYVLSAAHCFFTRHRKGPKPSNFLFYIGYLNLEQKPIKGRMKVLEATKIHLHPKFNFLTQEYDLALVRLNQSVPSSLFAFNTARTICLPQLNASLQEPFTVAGWGNNGSSHINKVPQLFEAKVDLYKGDCPDKTICTKSRPSDVCENDSGGPLMQPIDEDHMQLVGVVSHGPPCNDETVSNVPGVFTDVRKYLTWIKETMANDGK